MQSTIDIIKSEGINVYSIIKGNKEEPRSGYIITLKGNDVPLDENFFFDFKIEEKFNPIKNTGGYVQNAYGWCIIENVTGKEVFNQ